MKNYLNFETEIKKLEEELDVLKDPYNKDGISEVNTNEIISFEEKINSKLEKIYSNLNPWQTTQVARHEDRPKAKYFIENLFEDFVSLSGDRFYGEELADKFKIPIITFIDTPGAYPGVGAEERGQAEAIARSIETCMKLTVPNISIIIGEGGSGGAIALASASKVIMLENSIYSVISPEGCATILWRDPKKTLEAAEAMKLTSKELLDLKIIDEIIKEPIGGAHRDRESIIESVRQSIEKNLSNFENLSNDEIILQRKNKFLQIGRGGGFSSKPDISSGSISFQKNTFNALMEKISKNKKIFIASAIIACSIIGYFYLL